MVWRWSYSRTFRRDELAVNPQHIPGHRLSNYHLSTGSHSEILSVESKFEGENGCWHDCRGRSAFGRDHGSADIRAALGAAAKEAGSQLRDTNNQVRDAVPNLIARYLVPSSPLYEPDIG